MNNKDTVLYVSPTIRNCKNEKLKRLGIEAVKSGDEKRIALATLECSRYTEEEMEKMSRNERRAAYDNMLRYVRHYENEI